MSKVLIEVTQEDIEKGVAGHGCLCPIAHAVGRCAAFAERDVIIGRDGIYLGADPMVDDDKVTVLARFPDSAVRFIWLFDQSLEVKPFSFEAEIPDAATTSVNEGEA